MSLFDSGNGVRDIVPHKASAVVPHVEVMSRVKASKVRRGQRSRTAESMAVWSGLSRSHRRGPHASLFVFEPVVFMDDIRSIW